MEKDARGPGFQRSPKAGSAGVGFASREGGCSQLGSFLRNGEEGRNLGEEGMLVEGQEEGRREGGMRSTVSRRPGQAVGAGLFGSIRVLEASSGRVSTRSPCAFRFLSPRPPERGSRREDSGDGARPTADGLNHDLRRCRDDSACVQLEEILCAGRKVLHDCLVSQAMGMCVCVWWLACLAFAWLAWYMSR